MWDQFGPGAVGRRLGPRAARPRAVPAGDAVDPAEALAWQGSDEARAFAARSSEAWGEAYGASGAPADTVASAVRATTAFYAPPEPGN